MSKKLLLELNGGRNGLLKSFINGLGHEPRICWYPSAGEDFRSLLYLNKKYTSEINPSFEEEPLPPDLFVFTDYFPWTNSTFLDNRTIYFDGRTSIFIKDFEELPKNNLKLHDESVIFPEGSVATGRTVFMTIEIVSDKLGKITCPVLYCFAENETFYREKIKPHKGVMTHVIHVRYGGGLGGGGKTSGAWIVNALEELGCEVFITDNHHYFQDGDYFTLQYCNLPETVNVSLREIRMIESEKWSDHGDVVFYKVGKEEGISTNV